MNLIVCLCKKTHQIEILLPLLFQHKPSFASAIFDGQVLKQCSGRIWMCTILQSTDTHSEPDRHFVSAKPRSVIPSKMTTTTAVAMRCRNFFKISPHKYRCRRVCLKKSAQIYQKRVSTVQEHMTATLARTMMQILNKLSSLPTLHSCLSRN